MAPAGSPQLPPPPPPSSRMRATPRRRRRFGRTRAREGVSRPWPPRALPEGDAAVKNLTRVPAHLVGVAATSAASAVAVEEEAAGAAELLSRRLPAVAYGGAVGRLLARTSKIRHSDVCHHHQYCCCCCCCCCCCYSLQDCTAASSALLRSYVLLLLPPTPWLLSAPPLILPILIPHALRTSQTLDAGFGSVDAEVGNTAAAA